MTIEYGSGEDQIASASIGGADVLKLEVGDNYHHIITGPVARRQVFWRTQDIVNGAEKTVTRSISVKDRENTVFTQLAAVEKLLRGQAGDDKPKSDFEGSVKWYYLVINKLSPTKKVQIAPYGFTVFKEITSLQKTPSTQDTNMLMYGLVFMHDHIITRDYDARLGTLHGTSYSVKIDPSQNANFGKIPKIWLSYNYQQLLAIMKPMNATPRNWFNEQELEALDNSDLNLNDFMPSKTPTEIQAELMKSPIFLDAQDGSGNFIYCPNRQSRDKLEAEFLKLELKVIREGTYDPSQKALGAGPESGNDQAPGNTVAQNTASNGEIQPPETDKKPADENVTDANPTGIQVPIVDTTGISASPAGADAKKEVKTGKAAVKTKGKAAAKTEAKTEVQKVPPNPVSSDLSIGATAGGDDRAELFNNDDMQDNSKG